MATVTNLLAKYTLGAGDIFYIDTGVYSEPVSVGANDSGTTNGYVTIQGSTNTVAGGTVIQSSGNWALYLSEARYVRVWDVRLRNSSSGVTIYDSRGIELERVMSVSNGYQGFSISGSYVTMKSCVAAWNGQFGLLASHNSTVFENGVLWENGTAALGIYGWTPATISNSVIRQRTGRAYNDWVSQIVGDYNVFDIEGDASVGQGSEGTVYPKLSDYQKTFDREWHSIEANSELAGLETLDFRPKSAMGRYDPTSGSWVTDTVQSVCIDLGDPAAAWTNEPEPNGARLNVGLYGNTATASKSRTNAWLRVLTYNEGGLLSGMSNALYWTGGGFEATNKVQIEYSVDLGANWTTIATGIPATNGVYVWDVNSLSPMSCYWRVMSEGDTNVWDRNDQQVGVSGGGARYYVNDGDRNGDVYCTAVGDDANSGLTPAAPMATVTNLLAKYTLGAGDIFYIDTGVYSEPVSVGANDSGTTNGYVTIQGSTNTVAGGTVIQSPGNWALFLGGARYVRVWDVRLRNSSSGVTIYDSRGIELERVMSVSNGYQGFSISGSYVTMKSCVAAWNGQFGLLASHNSTVFENGVLWENGTAALGIYGWTPATISNSVIRQRTGRAYNDWVSQIVGDYNVFDIEGDASVGQGSEGTVYPKLSDYQKTFDREWHSIEANSELAGLETLDFRPKSAMGRYDPTSGSWVTDTVQSVCIDLGDPAAAWTNEPEPNGARLNVGLYGNTATASKSRTNAWLRVLTYNEGGLLSGMSNALYWTGGGFEATNKVQIEYSVDLGANWTTIATGIPATNGVYVWDVNSLSPMSCYWRVMSEGDTNVWDRNDQQVGVSGGGARYYVNDGDRNGDVYCTAVGDDANSGLTPAAPMATVTNLLAKYTLGAGDIFYIDTGVYSEPVSVGANDSGTTNGYVTIQGSTNTVAGGTVIQSPGNWALFLGGARYVRVWDVRLRNSSSGVTIYDSRGIELERVMSVSNGYQGFSISGSYVTMKSCVAAWNGQFGLLASHNSTVFENGVLWENGTAALGIYGWTPATISNSVIRQRTGRAYNDWVSQIVGDYNVFDIEGDASVGQGSEGTVYPKLSDYQKTFDREWHSIEANSELAGLETLDFRPKSAMGRYDPTSGSWVTDTVQSVCIDLGDPAAAWTNEPEPNGARLNVGLYGNTATASKSRTNAWLRALTFNDGGIASGVSKLYWIGGNLSPTSEVYVEYQADNGEWQGVATHVPVSTDHCDLNTAGLEQTFNARWRVVLESDPKVVDVNDQPFTVRNTNNLFYVNDASGAGDIYCTGIGSSTNSGRTPETPKDSIQGILDDYDLQPGDKIYVDTGLYPMANLTITITSEDQGAVGSPIVIQGSTNVAAGGTILDRQGMGGQVLYFNHADYIRCRDLIVRGAQDGIYISSGSGIEFERVQSVSNTQYGFYLTGSYAGMLHCVAAYNGRGLYVNSYNAAWEGGVLWANEAGVQVDPSASVTISNSVIGQSGGQAYTNSPQNILGDYNVFDLTGTAMIGGNGLSKLADYQQVYNREWHSSVCRSDFADPAGLDFHPKSTSGRYLPGVGWMNDAIDSRLIDMGAPQAPYANEPVPNGERLNVGLYGNTREASKSRTNVWLQALTFNDGGTLSEAQSVYWIAQHFTNGAKVRVEYSTNNGVTWVVIAQAIPANIGQYELNPFAYGSGTGVYWRVVSESDESVNDRNDLAFNYANGGASYYVNDNSRMGDVFTAAVGNDTNNGRTNSAPKATLQNLLDTYKLKGGDVVYIDTGIYRVTNDIVWAAGDSGYDAIHLRIQGSTNEIWPTSITGGGLVLQKVKAVDVNNLNIQDANTGLKLNQSSNCVVTWVQCHGNRADGFAISNGLDNVFQHCVSMNNAQAGLLNAASVGTRWESGVMWSNRQQGVRLEGGGLVVRNSAIASVNTNAISYYLGSGSLTADYNSVYVTNGAAVGYLASNAEILASLSAWTLATGCDSHSLSNSPGFVDPVAGDFHEKSTNVMGRYLRGYGWTNDVETSVLIDAGDPSSAYPNEPEPNGSRINIGLYGDTSESSKKPL